jgi:hypothetical protein
LVLIVVAGCWSKGADTTTAPGLVSSPQGALDNIVAVEAGGFVNSHAGCVLRRDGTVACWGGPNLLHEFGSTGRTQPVPGPFEVKGLTGVTTLVGGGGGTCAVRRDRTGVCWSGESSVQELLKPDIVQLARSSGAMCALLGDGTVECQGQNGNLELGIPPTGYASMAWRPVPGATEIVSIAMGPGACGVRRDGKLFCWGPHPFRDQRGSTRADFLASASPQLVPDIAGVKRLVLGAITCADVGNELRCGRIDDRDKPFELERLDVGGAASDIVQMSAGASDVCFVVVDGTVRCYGPGPRPYVMDGGKWDRRLREGYKRVQQVVGVGDAVHVSVASTHACVATTSGHARCWGNNEYGQLGDGTLADRDQPSWVVSFWPELMPGPGEKAFGCRPADDVARACMVKRRLGDRNCTLEAPQGYWQWGSGGGALCNEECMRRAMDEVNRRPIPPCECACLRAPRPPALPPPPAPGPPKTTPTPGTTPSPAAPPAISTDKGLVFGVVAASHDANRHSMIANHTITISGPTNATIKTNAKGEYSIELRPGKYVLTTRAPSIATSGDTTAKIEVVAGKRVQVDFRFNDGTRCLDGTTPIASPDGSTAVQALAPGDRVWVCGIDGLPMIDRVSATQRVAAPGRAVRLPVTGGTLVIAPSHLLADGSLPSDLSTDRAFYGDAHSYDLAVASGRPYFASGVAVWSTMQPVGAPLRCVAPGMTGASTD